MIDVDVVRRYCFLASSLGRSLGRLFLSSFLSFFLSLFLSLCLSVSSSTMFFRIPLVDFHRSCRCMTLSELVYLVVDIVQIEELDFTRRMRFHDLTYQTPFHRAATISPHVFEGCTRHDKGNPSLRCSKSG